MNNFDFDLFLNKNGDKRGMHMLGRKMSEETKFKMSLVKKGKMPKNMNILQSSIKNYKGDKVGYSALHDWIRSRLGTPKKCERCGTEESKKFIWHTISGNYKREIKDWIRLCVICHRSIHGKGIKYAGL